ncbi:MAG: anti-sigma factor domain-containing protein [Candidatus Binataceae bacterium]
MDHQDITNLLPLAALERLEPEEESVVEDHLRESCEECEAELREYREAGAALAMSLEVPEEAEHRVWEKLERRLHANATAAHSLAHSASRPAHADRDERRSGAGWWRGVALVATAAVIALIVYNRSIVKQMQMDQVHHLGQLETLSWELRKLRGELKSARIEADALHGELAERARLDRVLMAPDLQLTRLAPLGRAKGASAVVAVSPAAGNAIIHAFGLPVSPPGTTYELWWITKESGPIKAGTFYTQPRRTVVVPVSLPPTGQRVMLAAVTLEPTGGTSKPTGPMYLKGAPERE